MNLRIQDILEYVADPAMPIEPTVDKLEYGNPDSTVKGVVVTFLATQEVINKSKDLGVNLIITHEGIFYSHWDKREMLKTDPVYLQKRQTIEESKIAIFRLHDRIHKRTPDGIAKGLLQFLEWQDYEVKNLPAASILTIPETSLEEAILHVKKRLGLKFVRYFGDPKMICRRIGLLAGYRGGGELVIPLLEKESLDLVIYGEGPEWETPEYIRDAVQQGKNKALIVLGHAESEMPGMEYLAQKLQEKFSSIPIYFLSQKSVFQIF
ncbi:putative NIF3 family GTP cyclohydrolase 1 type 2 [Hydrogenispora ethanolica]|uniref:GTP cyclohydrolase 1 type 2 homolog n=1 Tax=Hydrogenispora ethanolica TaxID=1082276 RepID=A0A4R1QVL7_HYDET|nr:Nif3-like dinuclear metal center hexameric protein [Hydrogenispora ethanolica]TCL54230.1 putative NIF3 family GTP cyclohydrolase 1 type 2 [Hydrogenispora ethanolica]